jgi:leishmanolysin
VLTTAKATQFKSSIIPSAIQFWEQMLSVDAPQSVFISSGTCCAVPMATDTMHNSHLVLYVTFYPTDNNVLAWAGACRQDQHGRPIAGQANFGPNVMDLTDTQASLKVAVHEIAHALGFSSSMFSDYKIRNETGDLIPNPKV